MKKLKIKIRHRLPMEVVHLLKNRGSVVRSKKDYDRKREKQILKKEVTNDVV